MATRTPIRPTNGRQDIDDDPELAAMAKVVAALKGLGQDSQQRVIEYACRRLGLTHSAVKQGERTAAPSTDSDPAPAPPTRQEDPEESAATDATDGIEGVNVVAQKWIKRSGLSELQMSELFSLGVDEIDLVAKAVPGKTAKDRFHSVLLLQGIASYLGTGVARMDSAKLRESASHYDADPGRNFAKYMRDFSADASGSSSTGFTLTSRGLNSARDLIREMTSASAK